LFQPDARNQDALRADVQIDIPHDDSGERPQNIPGDGLGAGIQFSALSNDDEGSDQEQDLVYDSTPDHTADSAIEEDSGAPLSPLSLSSLFSHSRDRGHRALTVTTSDKTTGPLVSGVNTVLAILEQRKKDTSVLTSGNISVRDALRTKSD
jgi:hypothetical protein